MRAVCLRSVRASGSLRLSPRAGALKRGVGGCSQVGHPLPPLTSTRAREQEGFRGDAGSLLSAGPAFRNRQCGASSQRTISALITTTARPITIKAPDRVRVGTQEAETDHNEPGPTTGYTWNAAG